MLFFSVSFQTRNSSNDVRRPYEGALLSVLVLTWGSLTQTLSEQEQKLARAQANVPVVIPVQSTLTQIPYVSPMPSYITAHQQFPEPCNSLLGICALQKKKTTCHLKGHAAQQRRHDMFSLCTCPSVDPSLVHIVLVTASHFEPRLMLISASFKFDEHQYPSSESIRNRRAECSHGAACHPCR